VTLPVLHLDGTAYDQGLQHGRALREQIATNLDVYFDRFLREGQLPPDEARKRASLYQQVFDGHPYWHGMRGIADGSGQRLEDILVLNMRYELLYFQYGVCAMVDGCTSFAVLPEASQNGHLIVGQNWDWIPQVLGAVVHTIEPDGLETLSFTEAGIVGGKIGLNSAGMGLAINGLLTTVDEWSRLEPPFHLRCYEILRTSAFESAVNTITKKPRACSTNFVIAQTPDHVTNIEAAPDTLRQVPPDNGHVVHTNHFLDPEKLHVVEPPSERRPHSYKRQARMQELLNARLPVSVGDLESMLRDHDDHPDGICRHENFADPAEEHYITVTSAIMDLHERTLRLTDGPPCEHLYDGYSLAHTALIGR
jgi:isopenicillin-N N-acyltransferase like protein